MAAQLWKKFHFLFTSPWFWSSPNEIACLFRKFSQNPSGQLTRDQCRQEENLCGRGDNSKENFSQNNFFWCFLGAALSSCTLWKPPVSWRCFPLKLRLYIVEPQSCQPSLPEEIQLVSLRGWKKKYPWPNFQNGSTALWCNFSDPVLMSSNFISQPILLLETLKSHFNSPLRWTWNWQEHWLHCSTLKVLLAMLYTLVRAGLASRLYPSTSGAALGCDRWTFNISDITSIRMDL